MLSGHSNICDAAHTLIYSDSASGPQPCQSLARSCPIPNRTWVRAPRGPKVEAEHRFAHQKLKKKNTFREHTHLRSFNAIRHLEIMISSTQPQFAQRSVLKMRSGFFSHTPNICMCRETHL